jgi:hypothetical protein
MSPTKRIYPPFEAGIDELLNAAAPILKPIKLSV